MLKNSQTCNNLIHVFRILKLFYQIIIKSKNLIHIFAIAKGKSKMKLKNQLAYSRKKYFINVRKKYERKYTKFYLLVEKKYMKW